MTQSAEIERADEIARQLLPATQIESSTKPVKEAASSRLNLLQLAMRAAERGPTGVTLPSPRRKLKARKKRKKRKTAVVAIERADAHAPNKTDAPYDSLVPDATARAELGGVSKMTWWRWQRDPRMAALGFPVAITLCDRTYRSRAELEAFKARLMREAIKARSGPQRRGPKPKERA
jgi:hypothetical protein